MDALLEILHSAKLEGAVFNSVEFLDTVGLPFPAFMRSYGISLNGKPGDYHQSLSHSRPEFNHVVDRSLRFRGCLNC